MKILAFCLYASFAVFAYFLAMIVFTHFHIDFMGLRFVIELLTIPMFLAIPVVVFLAIRYYKRDKAKAIASLSVLFATIFGLALGSVYNIY